MSSPSPSPSPPPPSSLRPARPQRRRLEEPPAVATDVESRLEELAAMVTEGFAAATGPAHQLEEVVELLHAAIDHLLDIERRLDAVEQAAAAAAAAAAAKPAPAEKAEAPPDPLAKPPRVRRTAKQAAAAPDDAAAPKRAPRKPRTAAPPT